MPVRDDPPTRTWLLLAAAAGLTGLAAGAALGWLAGLYVGMGTPFALVAVWAGLQARHDPVMWVAAGAMALPAAVMLAVAAGMA